MATNNFDDDWLDLAYESTDTSSSSKRDASTQTLFVFIPLSPFSDHTNDFEGVSELDITDHEDLENAIQSSSETDVSALEATSSYFNSRWCDKDVLIEKDQPISQTIDALLLIDSQLPHLPTTDGYFYFGKKRRASCHNFKSFDHIQSNSNCNISFTLYTCQFLMNKNNCVSLLSQFVNNADRSLAQLTNDSENEMEDKYKYQLFQSTKPEKILACYQENANFFEQIPAANSMQKNISFSHLPAPFQFQFLPTFPVLSHSTCYDASNTRDLKWEWNPLTFFKQLKNKASYQNKSHESIPHIGCLTREAIDIHVPNNFCTLKNEMEMHEISKKNIESGVKSRRSDLQILLKAREILFPSFLDSLSYRRHRDDYKKEKLLHLNDHLKHWMGDKSNFQFLRSQICETDETLPIIYDGQPNLSFSTQVESQFLIPEGQRCCAQQCLFQIQSLELIEQQKKLIKNISSRNVSLDAHSYSYCPNFQKIYNLEQTTYFRNPLKFPTHASAVLIPDISSMCCNFPSATQLPHSLYQNQNKVFQPSTLSLVTNPLSLSDSFANSYISKRPSFLTFSEGFSSKV